MQGMGQEKDYLRLCKAMVEAKLGWQPSNEWKQRDFLQLIEVLEDKTGVLLSLSTVKRIWKPDFEGMPQTATLEAFARFLNYQDWLDFKTNALSPQPLVWPNPPAEAKQNPAAKWKKTAAITLLLVAAGIFSAVIFRRGQMPPTSIGAVRYRPEEVAFSCKNAVGIGVPNTVIFDYDVSRATADSFFIQQSWDQRNRARINPWGGKLTSTYFYPGYHRAKLIANDSIIRETNVQIKTNGWLAVARNGYSDNAPIYFGREFQPNGNMHISQRQLKENMLTVNNNTIVSYFNIGGYDSVSSSNFVLETQIKCDSLMNLACPSMNLIIQGEGEMYFISLIAKGCVGNISVKLGDVILTGKHHDLSAFGDNMYQWQKLRLEVKNHIATVLLNDEKILELPFKKDIGRIQGLNFNFMGTGQIGYVRLSAGHG